MLTKTLGHDFEAATDEPIAADMPSRLLHKTLSQPALRQVTLKVDAIKGINLSQGTCQLPVPQVVLDGAAQALADGMNRYSPADGVPRLREALVAKLKAFNSIPCGAENVAVTLGSTGALESICHAFLAPGEEVVLFAPYYPYHRKAIEERYKGVIRYVQLRAPDWTFDLDELDRAITPQTKFVLVCNPGNPTGKVFTRAELAAIGSVCCRRGIFCVTDEVYEYITFDGREHVSMASLPGLFDHTITIGSYSKTFAITGWRIGYLCAPAGVYANLRAASDQMYICPPTPLQYGVLKGLGSLSPDYYAAQLRDYERKRDILCGALLAAGFSLYRPQGAYYIIADTSTRFPGRTSEGVADLLIERATIGAVPASDFLGREVIGDPARSNFLRFCFAMPDDTLERAANLLRIADLDHHPEK